MPTSNTERIIFAEIQKKLFYMIPEKWDSIFLYASVVETPFKKASGEMFFYYIPKGILKRKPINVYEIPSLFNIDEESYNELIQKLYIDIKQLREIHREVKEELWSNITISIENMQFKVEYGYDNLSEDAEFTPYERHIIWRYKNLKDYSSIQSKEDKQIIARYLNSDLIQNEKNHHDIYIEGVYKNQTHNIIDYERTMTLEAAIAAQKGKEEEIKKAEKKEKKRRKKEIVNIEKNQPKDTKENQILFNKVEKMKMTVNKTKDDKRKEKLENSEATDDDIILNSDYMKKK